MAFRVIIPPEIERNIGRLHPQLKAKIRAALDLLADDPCQGKALKEELLGFHVYRVARYRIIYRIHRQTLEVRVLAVGHRQDAYQSVMHR